MLSSRILKRYQLFSACDRYISTNRKRLSKLVNKQSVVHREQYRCKTVRAGQDVLSFYEQDDNSRIITSRSDTITRKELKKQRRLLQDTLLNLHKKFDVEHPLHKLSLSVFCAMRPFWVVTPTSKDRETSCLCKLHENCRLIIQKLRGLH